MIYRDINGVRVSALGMGAMRLPTAGSPGCIDEARAQEIVDCLIEGGVNYFDTAWSYHDGASERFLGRALAHYPKEKWLLASKMPGHEKTPNFDVRGTFCRQLEKCGVDCFDFYLLHNVCENSIDAYLDENLRILDQVLEQKQAGHIRQLGFSTHARPELLRKYLERYPGCFSFVQIQLNYLDWTLQQAKEKYEMLTEMGLPVLVMEPVRGGKLTQLKPEQLARLQAQRPGWSAAAWALRFVQQLPNVAVTLSGMSTLEQAQENLKTFSQPETLTDADFALLAEIAGSLATKLPCTGCRYCCKGCPKGLDIPTLLDIYADAQYASSFSVTMPVEAMPEGHRPADCIGCGACSSACPQNIDIPSAMAHFAELLKDMPSWAEVTAKRNSLPRD